MHNSTKMNMFLQRMLRKSDDELSVEPEEKLSNSPMSGKSGLGKSGWIKKLGAYSPSKYKVPSSPLRSSGMRTSLDSQTPFNNNYVPVSPKSTTGSPLEMPDLESIIREFEMGFLSPTKQQEVKRQTDPTKQRNFVKKIVAAFEVKYKAYNDQKDENDSRQCEDEKIGRTNSMDSRLHFTELTNTPKRRSGIFASPFKSQGESRNNDGKSRSPSKLSTQSDSRASDCWTSTFFNTPISSPNVTKSPKKSGLFSSPFNRSPSKEPEVKSDFYMSAIDLRPQETQCTETTMDDASFLRFERDDSIFASRKVEVYCDAFALDDTKSMSSLDLDVTLPEPEETFRMSPTSSENTRLLSSGLSEAPGTPLKCSSVIDRTPKIVGAFLKKPIEVEDTSIDWIPITGKKLPRKKSLKKLLSVLTGRKASYEKKGHKNLFSSERNLAEEPRELQDSGYDERTNSSSSLASLISINEALLHQENTYVEPERRTTTLRTFRSKSSIDQEDEDEAIGETYCARRTKSKLLLTEVPREDVKLDLGPSFPSSTKILTMSLDRRAHCKPKNKTPSPVCLPSIPKHPFSSQIPKHPFVSMTKMDEVIEESIDRVELPKAVANGGLGEVEFRKSCNDIPVPSSARSSSSESDYDVPRRYISKSESRIPEVCMRGVNLRRKLEDEPVYDVPRSRYLERPKSSVYDDALSLKRRTADFPAAYAPGYYSMADSGEPHYATVKPRNRRNYLSQEILGANVERSPF